MALGRLLRQLWHPGATAAESPKPAAMFRDDTPCVLNVGGGSKQIPIPDHYNGWNHLLLDIDPGGGADLIHDARDLEVLDGEKFDAVYCSHNLEHYYRHEGARVLRGFIHVLKPNGFVEIRVPDLNCVMRRVVSTGMDIEDVLYEGPSGPITVCDVIYGWGKVIEASGVDFYAHKTGFTAASLRAFLGQAGFARVFVGEVEETFEVQAFAFKMQPTEAQRALLPIVVD